jgi:hypothetical protein
LTRAERGRLIALALTAPILWALLWLFAHTDRSLRMRSQQIALFYASFLVFAIAVALVWRIGAQAPRRLAWFVIAVGVIYRLSLAPVLPVTTSDIYRYLWEGRVIHAGGNPFRDPPGSPRLAHLRDRLWRYVGFKEVPAAYPPLAQGLFFLSDLIPADRVLTLKLLLGASDVGTILLLPGLLLRFGRPSAWALLYAWHPLVAGEVVARGHLDSLGIFFLVLALRLLPIASRPGRAFAGAALAASILSKGYALMAAPALLLAARPRRAWFAGGLVALTLLAYLPFLSAGLGLFRGLSLYSRHWIGNSAVYRLLSLALGPLTPLHAEVAWALCAIVFGLWMLHLLRRQRTSPRQSSLLDACFLSLAGFFLLSPVLFPWYLAWTVPFLCFRPRPVWLLLTGSVFGFYGHQFYHREVWWITTIEYAIPSLAAVVLTLRSARREQPSNAPRREPVC